MLISTNATSHLKSLQHSCFVQVKPMAPRQYDANAKGPSSPSTADHFSVELDVDSSGVPMTSATEASDFYLDLQSPRPQTQSMRLRLRKQASDHSMLSAEAAESLQRRVARVKKNKRPKELRLFKHRLQLAMRIAVGVLLAGVVQTHGTDREWLFLPASYYLGGLTVASMMVIYAAATTVGGVLEQVWQIDVGVAIALLYNFVVFACVPITQGDLMTVSKNINGSTYYVSLRDWGVTLPLLAFFTLVVLLSPMQTNVKKFAVSTNLYFMLTLINPMNPIFTTVLKDTSNSSSYYGTDNLLKQLAIYSGVGVVGTFIALATMILPFPIFAMKKLRRHMAASPHDIRDILNLIVDSYCFRAKDIKKMDFFKLRLDRLLDNAHERLETMESLLSDCWWEELVGLGVCFFFNKTVAKQLVKLYAQLLADLHAMKFAIEAETCHWTHAVLLNKMQTRFYVLQVEANDLLEDISLKIVHSSRTMSSPKFATLEQALERLMVKYTTLYGNLLSADVHTADDVGKTMPLNVFVYSFHVFVISLLEFEEKFNKKNFSARYRVKNFIKLACRSLLQPINYPRRVIIFAFRTTLAILIGICCATFIFGFSSTAPTAIAMVAEDNIGGTYGNTVNRVGGLIAGTVVPSIINFFVCKVTNDSLYNTMNNVVLFIWTLGSMYVWFSSRYMALAGMTSAYMAASVLLDHSCRSTSTSTTVSYASLTQNALGILILMVVEIVIHPRSSRGLLRSNIQQLLTQYRGVFHDVFRHHVAYNHPMATSAQPLTEEDIETANALLGHNEVKVLKNQVKVAIPELLKTQAKLVAGSDMEPTLWKPPFSTSKYTKVLNACRELLEQLDVLVDLVDWHENRRNSGKDKQLRRWHQSRIDAECTAAFTAAQEPPSPTSAAVAVMVGESNAVEEGSLSPVPRSPPSPLPNVTTTTPAVAKIKWDQSLAVVEAGVEEAMDTLVTLFGEEFSGSTAEDHAIYLQMKEAFRIADVHRRGVVDVSELSLLLEKLMPYSGSQGIEGMEQYVDEFMQLVDKDHDGKISFNEFMQALNEGFRLELEIYDDQPQVPAADLLVGPNGAQLAHSKSMRLQRKSTLRRNSIQSTQTDESDDPSTPGTHKHDPVASPPPPRERASSNFVDMSIFETSKPGSVPLEDTKSTHNTSRRLRFRGLSSTSESSAPEALLNVEAFTLTEAAAALKQSYGECLLGYVDDQSMRVTMEDFIVMSCVISACENVAENLTRLNTLAAS
uniref:EF-hand domain-containing protein n=1 Tax=Phytophthora ramorum TaxID=164328 RepID=H3GRL5_PHYRM